MMVDKQRGRVYSWERLYVAPHDTTEIPFVKTESIVKYIWEREGLLYPPKVEPLHKRSCRLGEASRTVSRFAPVVYTWVVLHELAHSMSSLCTGESNAHGAVFMANYLRLLHRYLNLNVIELHRSAIEWGLAVNVGAKPSFLEPQNNI